MLSWDRNKIETKDWEFAQVFDFSEFKNFDCGDNDLNDFIHNDAKLHKQELIAETYSFRYKEQGLKSAPVSFITLANDSIKLKTNRQKRKIPNKLRRYTLLPAVKIARLGVHKDMQRQKIGTLLIDIVKQMFTTNNRTGCRFITVDAYNNDITLKFYKSNDFQFLDPDDKTQKTRTMYYDLKRFKIMNKESKAK